MKPIVLKNTPLLKQVEDSIYSKKGLTTVTGTFEGAPQNQIVKTRGFTLLTSDQTVIKRPLLDLKAAAGKPKTYLQFLKESKRT